VAVVHQIRAEQETDMLFAVPWFQRLGECKTMADEKQKTEIEEYHKEYYDYLNGLIHEITTYQEENDGNVDSHKVDLFFEKIASPYVFWLEKKKSTTPSLKQEEKGAYLIALIKKYDLILKGDGAYMPKSKVQNFTELRSKMSEVGYVYKGGIGFVPEVKGGSA
jgi:hypothetical protein